MKIKYLLILPLLLSFYNGCGPNIKILAPSIKIASVASSYQKTDPQGAIVSEKKHTVTLFHYTNIKFEHGNTIFRMIIENRGKEPVKISNESISVTFDGKDSNWNSKKIMLRPVNDFMSDLDKGCFRSELRVYAAFTNEVAKPVEQLTKEIKSPMATIDPSNPESLANEEKMRRIMEELLDSYGETVIQLSDDIKLLRTELSQLKESIPLIFIKPQNIMPDEIYNGIVACDTRFMKPDMEGKFNIVISIDGENHEFVFSRSFK